MFSDCAQHVFNKRPSPLAALAFNFHASRNVVSKLEFLLSSDVSSSLLRGWPLKCYTTGCLELEGKEASWVKWAPEAPQQNAEAISTEQSQVQKLFRVQKLGFRN